MSICASVSRESAEPLAGTSATARTWLLLEQPGPWGAKALTASRLDPALGRALEEAAEGTGVRVALVRRPGRHADRPRSVARRVFVAHTLPGRSWIRTARITGAEQLPGLDFAALGAGDPRCLDGRGPWAPYDGGPLALVCTNGRRDRCCALLGRPLAAELAASGGGFGVWEVTHLGGHRFSPTLLVLPHGYAYGRSTARTAGETLEAVRDGRIRLDGCRGRSAWDRPGQAADLAVRALTGERGADALAVVRTDDARAGGGPGVAAGGTAGRSEEAAGGGPDGKSGPGWTVTVAHTDGRTWQVDVVQRTAGPDRPESCGAAPVPALRLDVVAVRSAEALGAP